MHFLSFWSISGQPQSPFTSIMWKEMKRIYIYIFIHILCSTEERKCWGEKKHKEWANDDRFFFVRSTLSLMSIQCYLDHGRTLKKKKHNCRVHLNWHENYNTAVAAQDNTTNKLLTGKVIVSDCLLLILSCSALCTTSSQTTGLFTQSILSNVFTLWMISFLTQLHLILYSQSHNPVDNQT